MSNLDPGTWRKADFSRPWYNKALTLMPALSHASVVELGAGHGELSEQLLPRVKRLICLDNSVTYVRKLEAKKLSAVQADLNLKLPLKANSFNLAVSLETIEHLVNAEGFLKEVYRILKPQGYLIISTPNIAWWGYRLYALFGQPPKKEGYHLRFFTHNTFYHYLNQAGFEVKNSSSFTTIPLLNRLLLNLKLKPIYPVIQCWPNLLAQDLVFLCRKK